MRRYRNFILAVITTVAAIGQAHALCRPVRDNPAIVIAPRVMATLQAMQIDRALAFDILQRTSIPETKGCWGGVAGNFDGQIVSVGAMQWNYGQQTLQFVLYSYRKSFLTEAAFHREVARLMPRYGAMIFSDDCSHAALTAKCRRMLLSHQSGGRLRPELAAEYEALFNSDAMIQIQVDRFLTILTSVQSDLRRLFGPGRPSSLKVKWAMDTKIQQGSFPKDDEVRLYRTRSAVLSLPERREELESIVDWYSGLAGALVQDGVRLDYRYNRRVWKEEIGRFYVPRRRADEPEKFDLLNLSFIRAKNARAKGGAYQCNSFQRRATIILGHGMLHGRRL